MDVRWYKIALLAGMIIAVSIIGCNLPTTTMGNDDIVPTPTNQVGKSPEPRTITKAPNKPAQTPTLDPPRILPTMRVKPDQYTVKANDTLGSIAQRYNIDLAELVRINKITDPDRLQPGQVLTIPIPNPAAPGPDFKIIPDSELVYSPSTRDFNFAGFLSQNGGYLVSYQEQIDGETYSGKDIVVRVAREFSVNPRLLLAVLDFQSGWLSQTNLPQDKIDFPMIRDAYRKGLYRQLSWTANNLNRGFYLWRVNAIANWVLSDGTIVPVSNRINAGTAGVQYLMALLHKQVEWRQAVSAQGIFSNYQNLFGYPFDNSFDPVLPPGLKQPSFQLPFENGSVWSFTGGPHGGWGDGSGWAALDFAPPGIPLGCVPSNAWVVAVADGIITRSERGSVVQDLDGDSLEQTGWSVLYQHIETRDRVATGARLRVGDKIGHPSCEGGVSNGTHVHIARRYNGEWIPADGPLPFDLDGWISEGSRVEYNGYLKRKGQTIEAWDGRRAENQIQR